MERAFLAEEKKERRLLFIEKKLNEVMQMAGLVEAVTLNKPETNVFLRAIHARSSAQKLMTSSKLSPAHPPRARERLDTSREVSGIEEEPAKPV